MLMEMGLWKVPVLVRKVCTLTGVAVFLKCLFSGVMDGQECMPTFNDWSNF
jgi:hypothetical protein